MSKLALITGGAKRIGKGITLSLAENGFDVEINGQLVSAPLT